MPYNYFLHQQSSSSCFCERRTPALLFLFRFFSVVTRIGKIIITPTATTTITTTTTTAILLPLFNHYFTSTTLHLREGETNFVRVQLNKSTSSCKYVLHLQSSFKRIITEHRTREKKNVQRNLSEKKSIYVNIH